jgi:hypothetical protein
MRQCINEFQFTDNCLFWIDVEELVEGGLVGGEVAAEVGEGNAQFFQAVHENVLGVGAAEFLEVGFKAVRVRGVGPEVTFGAVVTGWGLLNSVALSLEFH